jgi:hypothetical protein
MNNLFSLKPTKFITKIYSAAEIMDDVFLRNEIKNKRLHLLVLVALLRSRFY